MSTQYTHPGGVERHGTHGSCQRRLCLDTVLSLTDGHDGHLLAPGAPHHCDNTPLLSGLISYRDSFPLAWQDREARHAVSTVALRIAGLACTADSRR